jgi:hypothetical protein
MDIPLEVILSTFNNVILIILIIIAVIKGKNVANIKPLIENLN